MNAEPDDYRWLTGAEAGRILAAEAQATDALTLISRLRKTLSPARATLVAEQVDLRRRGAKKFSRAAELFFTKRGLEQATDEVTARYKAARFPTDAPLADFCCGIGGDLMALGSRGLTRGYDLDEPTRVFAEANCRVLRQENVSAFQGRAFCARVDSTYVSDLAAWHIDPDRRPSGKRTTHVELHEPPLETIETFVAANQNAAIKFAPATQPWPTWFRETEWEWISLHGECRQLVAWRGNLARKPGLRRATILSSNRPPRTIVGWGDHEQPWDLGLRVADLRRYVHEPDAAILAAQLITCAGEEYHLSQIFSGSAYLTSDAPIVDDAAWTSFEIVEAIPYDVRKLRAWLAARGIGRLEIKKRGVDLDIERLRSELKLRGDEAACLILIRRGDRVTAVVARRHPA